VTARDEFPTTKVFAERIRAKDRVALARAITLVESTRAIDRQKAEDLLAMLIPDTGHSLRLGVSGVPGAGKSTLIERLGMAWIQKGHRVAVLAVDPSSVRSGGSILGDKTRMAHLASDPQAFVRPSPTSGTLGGVARRTREAILLCEAAGYDRIIVETVGVGQSEVSAADLVDLFLLIALSGAGDELQGIKRGILEIADLMVINKADGDNILAAQRAARMMASSLHMLSSADADPHLTAVAANVLAVSALHGDGMDDLMEQIQKFFESLGASGHLEQKRTHQMKQWLDDEINTLAVDLVRAHPAFQRALSLAHENIGQKTLTPSQAARNAVQSCLKS
jgi:LAO/AO transport system kinase